MSEVKRLADAEAAKAEAESPDEEAAETEEEESQEVEPQTQPDAAPSGDPTEAERKAFDAETKRHATALRKLMGDDFDLLVQCDECGGWGYAPPPVLRTNSKYIMCETCNGHGVVLTGARNEQNATAACPVCANRGYLEKMPEAPAAPSTSNGETQQQPQYGTPAWMGNPDMTPSGYAPAPVT